MTFSQKLEQVQDKNNSLLCVGLDSDFEQLPQRFAKTIHPQFTFNKWIIDQTNDLICAYKPNSAFYEARGAEGIAELKATCDYIREKRPHIPVILDFKRADIGNTNNGYVQFAFDYLKVDAVTVNPYLGQEAIQPFLDQKEKGIIILCKTSNPGSGEFQDRTVVVNLGRQNTLYEHVVHTVVNSWNRNNNCLLVVGATYPKELQTIRQIAPKMVFLIPGIGSQGGDVKQTLKAGLRKDGKGLIINSSRAIIFSENPRDETENTRNLINTCRKSR
jgi:orotidine-5'-phosphate decarboxylase